MEKKTTQRIIGILVAIALIVILMPLVFSKNDLATQTAAIQAPPFPDQQQPEGVNPSSDNTSTVITQEMANKINGVESSPISSDGKPKTDQPQLSQSSELPSSSGNLEQPSVSRLPEQASSPQAPTLATPETTEAGKPVNTSQTDLAKPSLEPNQAESIENTKISSQTTVNTTEASTPQNTSEPVAQNANQTPENKVLPPPSANAGNASSTDEVTANTTQPVAKLDSTSDLDTKAHRDVATSEENLTPAETGKNIKSAHVRAMTHSHMTGNTKQSGWVVQLGSFKEKDNARHLADRLRTSGYKAFMREVKSSHGSVQTRVYVGPESQHASAVRLSTQVERDMKIHGFVTVYKPFEL